MEWNVFYHDFNGNGIKTYNVFYHSGFKNDVEKYLKEHDEKEVFEEKVRRSLMYYFWSKAEWEVIVTSWPPYIDVKELDRINNERKKTVEEYNREPYHLYVNLDMGEKIDVYDQVMNNWQIFIDYIWSYKDE